jgi:hypothetical protein
LFLLFQVLHPPVPSSATSQHIDLLDSLIVHPHLTNHPPPASPASTRKKQKPKYPKTTEDLAPVSVGEPRDVNIIHRRQVYPTNLDPVINASLAEYLRDRGDSCDPPSNLSGLENRHGGAWVDLNYTHFVVKHPNGAAEYIRERDITASLASYGPNFVQLYHYDDACELLYFERLQPYAGFRKKYNNLHLLNRTHITSQLTYIFDVLAKEKLVPSTEFYYGFCCNLYITPEQHLTMFDFGAFKQTHEGFFNVSKNDAILAKLLPILLDGASKEDT